MYVYIYIYICIHTESGGPRDAEKTQRESGESSGSSKEGKGKIVYHSVL